MNKGARPLPPPISTSFRHIQTAPLTSTAIEHSYNTNGIPSDPHNNINVNYSNNTTNAFPFHSPIQSTASTSLPIDIPNAHHKQQHSHHNLLHQHHHSISTPIIITTSNKATVSIGAPPAMVNRMNSTPSLTSTPSGHHLHHHSNANYVSHQSALQSRTLPHYSPAQPLRSAPPQNNNSTTYHQWPATPTAAAPKPFVLTVAEKLLSKHALNPAFLSQYSIQEELGSGGFGFVCSAFRKSDAREVAVKFIIKARVPAQGWAKDSVYGIIPLECYFIRKIKHPNIVGFIDYFEDNTFSYLVTELHGSPWSKNTPTSSSSSSSDNKINNKSIPSQEVSPISSIHSGPSPLLPQVNTNLSETFKASSKLATPTPSTIFSNASPLSSAIPSSSILSGSSSSSSSAKILPREAILKQIPASPPPSPIPSVLNNQKQQSPLSLKDHPPPQQQKPKKFVRRSSCDLFECIEQHERFSEEQARHVFTQIASAVHFLHSNGVVHRDIKDENILVDKLFNVKLIDFGSASFIPTSHTKLFDRFLGTVQYAAPEIFRGEKYKGPEAEIWALGCCLYIMLTGQIPFETMNHTLRSPFAPIQQDISKECRHLLEWMLQKVPQARPTVAHVLQHPWIYAGKKNSAVPSSSLKNSTTISTSSTTSYPNMTSTGHNTVLPLTTSTT